MCIRVRVVLRTGQVTASLHSTGQMTSASGLRLLVGIVVLSPIEQEMAAAITPTGLSQAGGACRG